MKKGKRSTQVAIVSTVRNVGPPLESFIRYHLALGFSRIYLYFDDPRDADLRMARRYRPQVLATPCDAAYRKRWRKEAALYPACHPFLKKEVMARQVLNAEMALRRAERDGIDWLLHIDSDELLWLQGQPLKEYFAALTARGCGEARFFNLEAVPETVEVDDYFREVTLFKKSPAVLPAELRPRALPYIAYANGKAAARVNAGVMPWGVHSFASLMPFRPSETVLDGFILHYPSCGFARYWLKYRLKGRFGDKYFDTHPIEIDFHLKSRDAVMGEDLSAARALYHDNVVMHDAARAQKLIDDRLMVRIDDAQVLLAD